MDLNDPSEWVLPSRYSKEMSEILDSVRHWYGGKVVTLLNKIVKGTSRSQEEMFRDMISDIIEKKMIEIAVFGLDHGIRPDVEEGVHETDEDFFDQLKTLADKNSSIEFFQAYICMKYKGMQSDIRYGEKGDHMFTFNFVQSGAFVEISEWMQENYPDFQLLTDEYERGRTMCIYIYILKQF